MVFSNPRDLQHIADVSSIAYSRPIERNTRVVVESLDAFYVKICREYAFGGYFGAPRGERAADTVTSISNIYDRPRSMWASDTEGALLVDDGIRSSSVWNVNQLVTPGNVTLDKTQSDQTHCLEFLMDDQDDILELRLNEWPGGRQYGLPAGVTGMVLELGKKESDATKPLQFLIKSTNSSGATTYWDDGASGWTTTIADAWTDLAASATLATATNTFNTQAYFKLPGATHQPQGMPGPPCSLMLRPKDNYAAELATLYTLSVYDSRVAAQGMRVGGGMATAAGSRGQNQVVLDIPYRCRLGILGDSAVAATITEIDKR